MRKWDPYELSNDDWVEGDNSNSNIYDTNLIRTVILKTMH